jgi:hypothetical protein
LFSLALAAISSSENLTATNYFAPFTPASFGVQIFFHLGKITGQERDGIGRATTAIAIYPQLNLWRKSGMVAADRRMVEATASSARPRARARV